MDVMSTCLCKGEVKVLALHVAPVHCVGEQIDKARCQVVAQAMAGEGALGSCGADRVGIGKIAWHVCLLVWGGRAKARPFRGYFSSVTVRSVIRPSSGTTSNWTLKPLPS